MRKILILFSIFLFAFTLRLWDFNSIGRTWDEGAYVEFGYPFIQLIKAADVKNRFWYDNPDHPPLARYLYGLFAQWDVTGFDKTGKPVFQYGFPHAKLASAILSSLTVVLVTLLGWEYVSLFVGISAGIVLAMLPFFLGFSQLATLESPIMFFFTASVYSFIKFLDKPFVKKWLVLCGIFSGLALLVKQSNALLFALFGIIYLIWRWEYMKKNYKRIYHKKAWSLIVISILAAVTFICLWPMPFFHLKDVISFHNRMWISNVNLPPPEVFFGRLILVPKIYYVVMFFITTPSFILILFFLGILYVDKKRTWILLSILAWFVFPFIQSLYPFKQHGVRYIIEIYAPLALLSGIGVEMLGERLKMGKTGKVGLLAFVILYLLVIDIKQSPYYIDYFNEVVNGSKGVYQTKTFQLGWWGEGTAGAVYYVSSVAKKNATVGVIFNQMGVAPHPENIIIEKYDRKKQFDYVVLNYFSVLREGFDASEIYKDYKKIHSIYANGAPIVDIYKKKR